MSQRLDAVIHELRGWILDGTYGAGDRFPNRQELLSRTGASLVTVQRAMKALAQEGFLQARGRAGTYVSDHPPHRCRIGIVFSVDTHPLTSRFYTAIERAAAEASHAPDVTYALFTPNRSDAPEERNRLEEELTRGMLAGLIFVGPPSDHWLDSPILTLRDLPRTMWVSPGVRRPGITAITLDPAPILEHALTLAKRSACSRLGVLAGGNRGGLLTQLKTACRGRLEVRDAWVQVMDCCRGEQVKGVTELLFAGDRKERPDLLLLLDDNLVEPVLEGLAVAGLKPGRDVTLIAQGNFPDLPAPGTPITWLGYDMAEGLAVAHGMITKMHGGGRPRPVNIPTRYPE
ncbi:MAG: winged helix-turn-helix domain-containing protein [Planctomycetota bacterium]|jgi:DNA-binding LacI/PurR family transcriptional regulator